MKKNGFTLLELLAVIVVLAIIALIVTPFVTKAIEEAKISQFATSSNNLANIVADNCAKELFTSNNCNTAYAFQGEHKTQEIKIKGKSPDKGVIFTDGKYSMFFATKNDELCSFKNMNDNTKTGKMKDNICVVEDKTNYNHNDDEVGLKGEGTQNNPYQISSIEDLVYLSVNISTIKETWSKNIVIVLTASLDFENANSYLDSTTTDFGDLNGNGSIEPLITELTTAKGFPPIDLDTFTNLGTMYFDGQNNAIKNLYEDVVGRAGLFNKIYMHSSSIDSTTIKNLNIIDAKLKSTSKTGALAGEIANGTVSIENVNISVDINATSDGIGAMIGDLESEHIAIKNVICQGKINTTSTSGYVGGVIGTYYSNNPSVFSNIIGVVEVNGNMVGGIFSKLTNKPVISNIANFGNVEGVNDYSPVGGVAGSIPNYLTATNVYNFGEIRGTDQVGGIIGQSQNEVTITHAYNYGEIFGKTRTGGIIGSAYTINITDSVNYGNIDSMTYVGGIIGQSTAVSTISNLSNYGNITVHDINSSNCYSVGGIGGEVIATINSNNYGTVTSSCSSYNKKINAINGSGTETNCNNYGTIILPS